MTTDFENKIAAYRREIDHDLAQLNLPAYPGGLYEPMQYSVTAPGKRIRPLLTFLTGEGLGVAHQHLRPAALAVEILHAFTLVHDDIMDHDTKRRGLDTVHVKWDVNTAILSGDGLMALAFRQLMDSKASRIQRMGWEFSQAMLEICEGQSLDMAFERRLDVTTSEYLEMVGKKTGRLLGLACQLAALVSPADQAMVESANHFGIELGQAFQIQDDLLEISSDAEKMGKSLDSDIQSGKKTYPLLLMLTDLDATERVSFIDFMKKNLNNRGAILTAYQRKGILDRTRQDISQILNSALKRLEQFPAAAAENLAFLVDQISKRQQ